MESAKQSLYCKLKKSTQARSHVRRNSVTSASKHSEARQIEEDIKKEFTRKTNKYKCLHCTRSFLSQTSLNKHNDTVNAKTELRPKSFSHELTLKRHIKTAHGCPTLYPCDEWGANFRRRDALTKHMKTVHCLHEMAILSAKCAGKSLKMREQY